MQNPMHAVFERFGLGIDDVLETDDVREIDGVRKVGKLWKYGSAAFGGIVLVGLRNSQFIAVESSNHVIQAYGTVAMETINHGLPLAGALGLFAMAAEFRTMQHQCEDRIAELSETYPGENHLD